MERGQRGGGMRQKEGCGWRDEEDVHRRKTGRREN